MALVVCICNACLVEISVGVAVGGETTKPGYVPYQICPKCHGQGTTNKPPWVAGDQMTWDSTTAMNHICNVCNGAKIIPQAKVELSGEPKTPDQPTDEHWTWEGKPDWLKKLCWKLDREIWAKVEVHEATQSWGREQSAIAICQAIYDNEVGKCGKSILDELKRGAVGAPSEQEIDTIASERAQTLAGKILWEEGARWARDFKREK